MSEAEKKQSEPQVQRHLGLLSIEVALARETMEEIEARLSDVLMPERPTPDAATETCAEQDVVPVADTMRQLSRRMNATTERYRSILSRLGV